MTSTASFDSFYAANYGRLAAALGLTCSNKGLGEELAQETFVKAFSKWNEVSGMESPDGWLYRVGFNLARRHWRISLKRKFVQFEEDWSQHDEPNADGHQLRAAIEKLPMKQRSAVVARYVLGYSGEEAAEMLSMSPGALRVTLHRATSALRIDPAVVELWQTT